MTDLTGVSYTLEKGCESIVLGFHNCTNGLLLQITAKNGADCEQPQFVPGRFDEPDSVRFVNGRGMMAILNAVGLVQDVLESGVALGFITPDGKRSNMARRGHGFRIDGPTTKFEANRLEALVL